ncbi:hypothetical protein [Methylobacterium iners]|uniref:Uncharacterized protein n=1 Tax=Methylobacterium iners TaxID=418707 RepID=A0ABQ4RX40_9HYPH|nr:hypothetical protein [Methylobacterium iners]GJD95406.1 hypothetical protein OCOJLMKI_2618 [Methylobacterium iners]
MTVDLQAHEIDRADGVRRYRAIMLHTDGHVLNAVSFSAFDDNAALTIAKSMVDGHAVELWEGTRFIEQLNPTST